MAQGETPRRPLTIEEMADYLRCSVMTVRRRMKEGLPHNYVGSLLRFYPDDVDEWIRSGGSEPTTTHERRNHG